MKALTICQPYAELIARGEKLIENRTWPTSYRGPLMIHAGKSRYWLTGEPWEESLPFGAIVAVADLVACLPRGEEGSPAMMRTRTEWPPCYQALFDHEHANGPWCWILKHVRRLGPIPYRGAQGLYDIPDEVLR